MSTSPSLAFSAMLPVKPSQTITSALPLYTSRASTLPMKFNDERLEQLVRVANQLGALALFLADRQQPDARALDAERDLRVHRAHRAELQQVRRAAFHVGADVEQNAQAIARWNGRRQRRPIDARQHAERAVRAQHRRAGVPRAHERRGLAVGHRVGRDTNRRARLAPQRGRRRLGHADDVGRVENADAELCGVGMSLELGANRVGRPGEQKPEIEMTRGSQGAVDDAAGRVVAAHRVYGDANHSEEHVAYASSTARTWRPR